MRTKLVTSLVAITVIVGAGSYGTYAAFTDTVTSSGNSFAAGDLALDAEGATGALFAITNIAPGDAGAAKCLKVTNGGTLVPDSVVLAMAVGGTGVNGGDGLQDELRLKLERGTSVSGNAGLTLGGNDFSCDDFVPAATIFDDVLTAYSAGWNEPAPWAAGTSRFYRVTPSLPTAAQDAEEDTASVTLTWTATT